MDRIPYNNRGRGSMGPRYDRSESGPRRGVPHYNTQNNYGRPMEGYYHQAPAPPPAPTPGYNNYPPPRQDMGGRERMPRGDAPPRQTVINAAGPSTDTAKHAK